jgi:hypothetical protein
VAGASGTACSGRARAPAEPYESSAGANRPRTCPTPSPIASRRFRSTRRSPNAIVKNIPPPWSPRSSGSLYASALTRPGLELPGGPYHLDLGSRRRLYHLGAGPLLLSDHHGRVKETVLVDVRKLHQRSKRGPDLTMGLIAEVGLHSLISASWSSLTPRNIASIRPG